jgi:hypothetical protein
MTTRRRGTAKPPQLAEGYIDLSWVEADHSPEEWHEPDVKPTTEPTEQEIADEIVLIEERLVAKTDTWDEDDVGDLLAEGLPPEAVPTILRRTDGARLLYPGKISSIAGPPESAKGWFACLAARQVIEDGGNVLYIDFEDSLVGVLRRMLQIGVPEFWLAASFHYINPMETIEGKEKRLWRTVARTHPKLIILDGLTQALANENLDDNKNTDVVAWFNALPRKLVIAGGEDEPAVLIVDHVTKANTGDRYALGAGQKLAALDGTQFKAKMVKPFSHGKSGKAEIRVTKDRPGAVRAKAIGESVAEGQIVAMLDLQVVPGDEHNVIAKLWPPDDDNLLKTPDLQIVPTRIMDDMMKILVAPGQQPLNKTELKALVKGNSQAKHLAINQLLKDGKLVLAKEFGDTGRLLVYVNRNYAPTGNTNARSLP